MNDFNCVFASATGWVIDCEMALWGNGLLVRTGSQLFFWAPPILALPRPSRLCLATGLSTGMYPCEQATLRWDPGRGRDRPCRVEPSGQTMTCALKVTFLHPRTHCWPWKVVPGDGECPGPLMGTEKLQKGLLDPGILQESWNLQSGSLLLARGYIPEFPVWPGKVIY